MAAFDPTSATPVNSTGGFDPSSAAPDDSPSPAAVIPLATRQNPDAAGKASRMARETGISFDTVLRNSPEVELRINSQRAADAAAKTVTLSRMMADYEFAAKAHDEAEKLGLVERTVRGLGGGLLSPLQPSLRGAGEMLDMVQRRGIQAVADLVLPTPQAGGGATPESLTGPSIAEGWRAAAAGVGEFSREVTGIDPRAATFYDNVLSGLGQLPTQIALSLATGGTSNFAQGVGIMADKTDKDPNKASAGGDLALLLGGAITMATERITEKVIPKGLMDGKVMDLSRTATTGRVALAGATESLQEGSEGLLHDITRKALVNPNAPIQLEQNLQEAGVGGVVGAVARSVVEGALRIRARNVRANTAEDDATRLQQLMSAVGQLRLLERDRASVADFVQAAAADSDNAPTHLYMDGRTLGEVLDQGGISVDQLKEMLPAVASQLEAVGTNSPVAIPVGELMAALPGTNLEQVFLQNLRSTPEGLSQLEATAAREQTEQLLNQEITRIGGQLAQTQQFMAERDEIQTILADEITRTGNGGLTQTDAQKSATLVAAGMASVAARLRTSGDARFENITPMGLFNMYRMRVADSVVGAQDTLSSTNTKLGQLDNVEAFHFSKAERRVISTAMFGTGLKGSNRETYATAQDARLRKRAYFYVDKGTGINPEAGVGGIGHKALLSNVYDADSDPMRLKGKGGQLDFEARVLDAGFSGYLSRMEGGQSGQVILLGDQMVQPQVLGPTGKTQGAVVPAPKPREARGRDIVTDALKSRTDLPTGALSPARWSEVLSKLMPETHAAMQEAGVFDGQGSMYKSELIKAYEAVTPEPVYAQSVSTRVPTAVKAIENPLEDMLVIGLDAAKADPKAFAKNVELLRGYLNFRDNKSASTPEKAAEQFISHAVDNLLWLFDQVPAETRVRSKLWYDGARAIAEQWAAKYGITEAQAAGMLAVLSPQKDWYQNVSLAERVLDVMSSKQDFAWTAEMDATVVSLPVISEADAAAIRGKTLAQLDSDYLQAIWVRVYDQTYHERGYRIISPEGQFTEWATNLDGESRSKTAWGSFTEIGKAISVFKNGDIANISDALGGQHKVRNFYNNIFNPASAHGDVTIDTHAVAAALLRPLSGSADEVLHNFGSGGAANSSVFGAKGTYGIYAEAYRRAAEQRGVLPREMQSITWEAVRGLYTAKFKAQNVNVAAIDAIWAKYKKRKASLDDTRTQLLALAGGVNPPTWEQRPGAPASETPWASSYTEELRASSGADGAAGGGARSAGVLAQSGGVASGAATSEDFTPEGVASILQRSDWAILTAENPNARDLTPEENAERNAQLQDELLAAGYRVLPAVGRYGSIENSFVVLGITEEQGLALARKYEQQSILTNRGLVYPTGELTPAIGVTSHADRPADFFTSIPSLGTLFTVNLDFESGAQPDLSPREEQILNQETQRPGFGPPLRLEDFVRPETLQSVQEALQAYVKGGSIDPLTPEQRAQAEATLAPARALAEQAKPAFDAAVQEVADSLGGDVKLAGVKGMRRAAEKLVLDSDPGAALSASTIKDFLRATIIVPTMADVPQAVAALQARFKVSRAKDRFAAPLATGYRDVLMNVVTPDGSIAEVQITVPAMLAAKDVGHKLYEMQRALPEGAPEAAEFEALQQALYGEAFAYAEAALASTASAAAMSSGLEGDAAMKNSAEGTGAPLRAQTALPSGSLNTGEPSISKSSAPGGMASGSMFSSNEPIVADSKDLRQGPRGQFQPSTNVVALLAAANKSTFLHESGHFYLEMMADLASMPNPPQFIVDDMAKVFKWFGVKDLAGWQALPFEKKRPLHEKFAEGFEQYLFEGRAPSVELRSVFASFASWLKDIYRTVRDFAKASGNGLNDEVRGVFDRLLAADEEISRVRELETFEAIFKSAEQAGMTPEEWQAYKAQQQAAIDKAMELMQPRVLRDMQWAIGAHNRALAKIRREMAAKRKEIREQVEQEVDALPQFAAGKALADGQAEFELDPTAADFNAAALADAYGFPSIDAMYSAVEAAVGTRDSVADALTDQRMLEQEGLLATAKGMETAAAEAVMNEAQAKFVATELLALERAGKQNEKTATGGTVNVLDRAARDFAKELVGRRGLAEIDPARFPVPGSRRAAAASMFRAAANRAGALANKALAGGDTAAAAQAKRDQTLNTYAAVEAQKARDEMNGIFEFFGRVTRGNEQKLVDKGRDPDIVNAARAVLAAFGVSPRTEKSAREYLDAVKAYDPGLYAVIEPSITAAEQQAKPANQLTMAELRDLRDEVKALWDLAKRSRQMEVEGNMLDLADAELQLQQRLEDIGIPDTLPGEEGAMTDGEKALRKLQFFLAAATRMESWVERMDGRFGGPFARLVFGPVKDAANKYRKDKAARIEQFVKLLDGIKPFMTAKSVAALELNYTFGRDGGGAMNEILHALLHTGNASNKRKLLLGRGWATQNADGSLDTSKWDTFIKRMADDGVLRKEHMDFVQGVWDLLEDMKPAAQEAHRTVYGRYFSEITAEPVQTPFGEYRGGYAPAQVDTALVVDGELRKLAEAENENMAFSFPSTNRGFTKGRVEYNRPLKLDLRTLTQHIDKVLLFTHMQSAVTDVNRLLRRKGVGQPLARVEPTAYSGLLMPWLNTAARQAVETPVVGDGGLLRFFTALRGRAGLATMMANVSNTAQQVTGLMGAAAKLKSNNMKPAAIITSMARYVAGPKEFTAQVAAASDYMANRMDSEVAAMHGLMEEVLVNPSLLKRGQAWTAKHAYFMQSAVDNIFSPVVWTAGFNQAVEQGMTDANAVRYADNLVRTTQGSSLPEDVSRLETGHPFVRMFSQFMGYTNMLVNTNGTALVNTYKDMGFKKGAGRLFFIAVMGYLGQYWVSEAISQAFRGGPDDEDDDGRVLDDWLTAVFGMGTAKGVVSAVPVVNVAGQAVANRFNSNPMDDRISPSPALSLLESAANAPFSVSKAVFGEGSERKAVRDVASMLTLATGLPFAPLARPLSFAAGVAAEEVQPTSTADFARGLATGAVSPESRTP